MSNENIEKSNVYKNQQTNSFNASQNYEIKFNNYDNNNDQLKDNITDNEEDKRDHHAHHTTFNQQVTNTTSTEQLNLTNVSILDDTKDDNNNIINSIINKNSEVENDEDNKNLLNINKSLLSLNYDNQQVFKEIPLNQPTDRQLGKFSKMSTETSMTTSASSIGSNSKLPSLDLLPTPLNLPHQPHNFDISSAYNLTSSCNNGISYIGTLIKHNDLIFMSPNATESKSAAAKNNLESINLLPAIDMDSNKINSIDDLQLFSQQNIETQYKQQQQQINILIQQQQQQQQQVEKTLQWTNLETSLSSSPVTNLQFLNLHNLPLANLKFDHLTKLKQSLQLLPPQQPTTSSQQQLQHLSQQYQQDQQATTFQPSRHLQFNISQMNLPQYSQDPLSQHHVRQQQQTTTIETQATPTAKKKRRRVITTDQRRAANIRERKRMSHLNEAFDGLRKKVPTFAYEKKLSRIETLKLAVTYIKFMADLIKQIDSRVVVGGGSSNNGNHGNNGGFTGNVEDLSPLTIDMNLYNSSLDPQQQQQQLQPHHHHHHHFPPRLSSSSHYNPASIDNSLFLTNNIQNNIHNNIKNNNNNCDSITSEDDEDEDGSYDDDLSNDVISDNSGMVGMET